MSLTAKLDQIVVTIEESNDLFKMNLEELQASQEAREMGLKQRNFNKVT